MFIPVCAKSCSSLIRPSKERCVVRPVHLLFRYISSAWTLNFGPHPQLTFNLTTVLPTMSSSAVRSAVPNGLPRPVLDLPVGHCFPQAVNIRILRCPFSTRTGQRSSRTICSSLQSLRLTRAYNSIHLSFHSCTYCTLMRSVEGRRVRFIFKNLISKLHEFVSETKCVLLIALSGCRALK